MARNSKIDTNLKLISEKGELTPNPKEFESFLTDSEMSGTKNYRIVSIIGGQSGGKSTILNVIFDTKFSVLPLGERKAMTKGVVLAVSPSKTKGIGIKSGSFEKTLLLDLEGSDSNEKSESEGETFARQSALFALAVSDVLIVNVWTHDIGKRNAANLNILRSIFEVNLRISVPKKENKTILLFALRDYDARMHGTVENISAVLMKDLKKIWDVLEKPKNYDNCSMQDIFIFEFTGLPHKEYKKSEFLKEAFKLKSRFVSNSKHTIFLQKTKLCEIPVEALHQYFSSLWTSIKTLEDLNIASQKESLTSHICEKAFDKCTSDFEEISKTKMDLVSWRDFGTEANNAFVSALSAFDEKVFPLGKVSNTKEHEDDKVTNIRLHWRQKLSDSLERDLKEIQKKKSISLTEETLLMHYEQLKLEFKDKERILKVFAEVRSICRSAAVEFIEIGVKSLVVDSFKDQCLPEVDKFIISLEKTEEQFIQDLIQLFEEKTITGIKKEMLAVSDAYCQGGKSVWKIVQERLSSLENAVVGFLSKFEKNSKLGADKMYAVSKSISVKIYNLIKEDLQRRSELADNRLMKEFDSLFRFDESGTPRRWENVKNINEIWFSAKEECVKRIRIYQKMCITWSGETKEETFFDNDNLEKTIKSFESYALSALREAEIQHNAGGKKLPLWVFFVMFVLGFNELMWVLKNPVVLFLALVVGGYFWVVSPNQWDAFEFVKTFKDFLSRTKGVQEKTTQK